MVRKLPKTPQLTQAVGRLKPKVELVIVCEGRNTEPEYFRSCVNYYGAGMVSLRVVPGAGVPITLIETAVSERNKLIAKRNESKDSYDQCFRVWAVFDRDDHPGIPEAFALAHKNRIDIAFSNPCFELWPLLHLELYGAQDGRAALQHRLFEMMPKYDHQNGAYIDFPLIRENFEIAYSRAQVHVKAREHEDCPLGNPSTTVGNLVLKVIQNGKKAFCLK